MRMTERPEGWLLTGTSEPCGHRLSGDEAGFGRSFELGRCVTGIKRADAASEIQYVPAKSSDVYHLWLAERDGHPAIHLAIDAVTVKLIQKFPHADPKNPRCSVAAAVSTADARALGRVLRSRLFAA